jgi:hypothetical protein
MGLVGCRGGRLSEVKVPIASRPGYEYFYLASQRYLDTRSGLRIELVGIPTPSRLGMLTCLASCLWHS